jgi:hypothetical protein
MLAEMVLGKIRFRDSVRMLWLYWLSLLYLCAACSDGGFACLDSSSAATLPNVVIFCRIGESALFMEALDTPNVRYVDQISCEADIRYNMGRTLVSFTFPID